MQSLSKNLRVRYGSTARRFGARRGGTLIETAFVLLILTELSFGMAEYGYYFFIKNSIMGAAREGARAAIVASATNTTVDTAISNVMTAAHISTYSKTYSPTDVTTATSGQAVTVTITCNWGTVGVTPLPVACGGLPTNKQVIGTAVMRHE